MECQCGKYAVELTALSDGTRIYYCYECRRLWGERLVEFDVTFDLKEVSRTPTVESIEIAYTTPNVIPKNGSGDPTTV
jgi:hypothetical protein